MINDSNIVSIYKITNIVNNKCYIGSSFREKDRLSAHFNMLKRGVHHSYLLQRSYNKYGKDVFKHEILGYCSDEVRNFVEGFYIEYFNAADSKIGFNSDTYPSCHKS